MKFIFPSFLFCFLLLQSASASADILLNEKPFRIFSSVQGWEIKVPLPAFGIDRNLEDSEGNVDFFAVNVKKIGWFLSIFSKKADQTEGAQTCLSSYLETLQNSLLENPIHDLDQVRLTGESLEFFERTHEGKKMERQVFLRCFVHKGHWVYVGLSKMFFKQEERLFMETLFKSLTFRSVSPLPVKKASVKPNNDFSKGLDSLHYFFEGQEFWLKKSYKKVIPLYLKSLALNKKDHLLEAIEDAEIHIPSLWHKITDDLGVSYALSGQLNQAEKVYLNGIKKDPRYPQFYYNLAATYAEMGDLDKAIANLEKAYQNFKSGSPFPDGVPDLASDSSFTKFLKDPSFQKILKKFRSISNNNP